MKYLDEVVQKEQAVEHTTLEGYKTGKRYVPEFGTRTMVHVVVSDSMEKALISEIMDRISYWLRR